MPPDTPTDGATETPATGEASTTETRSKAAGLRAWLAVYLKGVAMGSADTVPGVSGGTIALVVGIYERFVRALTALDPRVLRHVPTLHTGAGRRAFIKDLRRMDVVFLIVLGLGVATAIVTLSRVVHAALAVARPHTFAFFFGLIAASTVVLYGTLSVQTVGQAGAAVVGFALAFFLAGVSGGDTIGHALPVVFGAGAVAVTAMVLPGISGAFILLLLGQYEYLTGVLGGFVDALIAVATGDGAAVVPLATIVVTFCAGATIGLLSIAHVIRRALDRYRTATLAFLVSLMLGSLRLPVAEVTDGVTAWTPVAALSILAAAAIGAASVLLLDWYTQDVSAIAD